MIVYLVRHATAGHRASWDGDDQLRPLDERGVRQAEGLDEALEAAAAQDIVDGLPRGLDSVVAERGRSFSGGQQQRLRLVRALVADPGQRWQTAAG